MNMFLASRLVAFSGAYPGLPLMQHDAAMMLMAMGKKDDAATAW